MNLSADVFNTKLNMNIEILLYSIDIFIPEDIYFDKILLMQYRYQCIVDYHFTNCKFYHAEEKLINKILYR